MNSDKQSYYKMVTKEMDLESILNYKMNDVYVSAEEEEN
jgi:hypothetical protein